MRKFLRYILALIFLGHIGLYAQDTNDMTYADKKGVEFFEDTTNNIDIRLYGLTSEKFQNGQEKILPGVIVTMRDLYGETVQITTDDSAFYDLELKFDNIYLIYYEYQGMYTKYLEIDTRDVIDIEQERGYLFPTDMSMQPASDFEISALYLKKPIGKAYFDRRLQMIMWDLKYTDRLKSEIAKINSKSNKKGKK